jgi:hypothetical protein
MSTTDLSKHTSRRNFLRASGALPAAIAALEQQPAKAAEEQKLPQVQFGKYSISRMVCGANPFGGLSHLSAMINFEMRQYYTPEGILDTLRRCQEAGVTAAQAVRGDIFDRFVKEGGKLQLFSNGRGEPADIAKLVRPGCIGIHHFGVTTDELFKDGKLNLAREYLKRVRDTGLLVGLCSHIPAVIDMVESQGWDVDYYMTCVYQWGRSRAELEKLYADHPELLPEEAVSSNSERYPEVFLRGDPPRMYKVVRQMKKPCLVYKILAAGRKCERPGSVEAAFKEAFENIKPTDAIIVGFFPKYADQITEDAEYVRRYGSPKSGGWV